MVSYYKKGISLMELMVVVAIIGVIAAIVYPSYIAYKVRVNRTDMQTQMLAIGQLMSSQKMANSKFSSNSSITQIYGSATYSQGSTVLYNLAFTTLTDTTWVLTATPAATGPQKGDGIICLNDQGQKYWAKGSTACVLSASSNWDGR